jgi:2-amino-4-hydroxy-6-hydroxymethyldihydropteridine diphosphokinase
MCSDSNARSFLGLGTNQGNRKEALREAVLRIHALPRTKVVRISPVYETDPWGYTHQSSFLNCALDVETGHSAHDFFRVLQQIENDMGRVPSARYHPRLIDIDILFYGEDVVDTPELKIPHPSLQERLFVLVPMCDIAPHFVHPLLHKTMAQLRKACTDEGAVTRTSFVLGVEK